MRRSWKRFCLILLMALLALLRVESTAAHMQGRLRESSRILGFVPEPGGVRLRLLGWEVPVRPNAWNQVRAWRADR